MRSQSQSQFTQIAKADIQRSSFDRSAPYKTTFNSGLLIPIFVDEVLPGDTFALKMTAIARMATPIYPIMDNLHLESFFFFVPNRLVWDNWQKFNGEQAAPGDSTDFTIPLMTKDTWVEGSMADYFGLPVGIPLGGVNALPFRCYNLIWNEWFRDQNLQQPRVVTTGDANSVMSNHALQRRGKRKDYFTSALPWPQKGPGVDLPLGISAPVGFNEILGGGNVTIGDFVNDNQLNMSSDGANVGIGTNDDLGYPLVADLTQATAATINDLRQAFQMQRLYERDARGGTRYTEILKAHFGVTSPDARLQRPEYLGGGYTPVIVHPVANTAANQTGTAREQGDLAAYATAQVHGHGFTKSFTEHGYIIGMVCVRADLTYQQGINRMWTRQTRFDFYWPVLSHLGEQEVLNKEIYYQDQGADDNVFGYQERYAEYRYKPGQITGQFRSTAATPLDAWHLSQEFTSLPTLSSSFIAETPPIGRVIAVPTEPEFLLDAYFNLRCARPMPMYATPGLIDHF